MKRLTLTLFVMMLLSAPLGGAELAGITLQDSITVDGARLTLNGAGIRTKLMFKVYVAGLYLEQPTNDASVAISSDQLKRVEMVMMRELSRDKITEAVTAGFENNNKGQMPVLRARLDRFNAGIPDLNEGDRLTITYAPGKGTTLTSRAGKTLGIEGKDFADALLSVWLGAAPVDQALKDAMLAE